MPYQFYVPPGEKCGLGLITGDQAATIPAETVSDKNVNTCSITNPFYGHQGFGTPLLCYIAYLYDSPTLSITPTV